MTRFDENAYYDALERADKEARATTLGALLIALFFWGAIFCLADLPVAPYSLPLWFWVAVLGGYLLSVVVVWALLRFIFQNGTLDFSDKENPQ